MPRIARVVVEGLPHHITQRGNYGQSVYDNKEDRRQYLIWLKKYCEEYDLSIWAYCLMLNHVHFVAVPKKKDSLARVFNVMHMRYAQYLNKKRGKKSGHLWQGRFFSCPLDGQHLYHAVRYVERNPVRAELVVKAEDYLWSSARCHATGDPDPILSSDCPLLEDIDDWVEYISNPVEEEYINRLIQNTKTGKPLGDEEFIREIEQILDRDFTTLPRGRPRQR